MTIILGIDPGSRFTGYGVIRYEKKKLSFLACGVIRIKENTLPEKLQHIFNEVSQCVESYHPSEAAYESVFMHKNAQSALKLGHARGAAMVAASVHGVRVYEYTAKQVKQAVVGYGAANKAQVQHMIRCLLNLSSVPAEDAADALAIAVCHAHSSTSNLYTSKETLRIT